MSTLRKPPLRSMGSLPTDCVASVWKRMDGSVSLVSRESSSMGKITPVSLLACMIVTSSVSGVSARTKSRTSSCPLRSTGRNVTS